MTSRDLAIGSALICLSLSACKYREGETRSGAVSISNAYGIFDDPEVSIALEEAITAEDAVSSFKAAVSKLDVSGSLQAASGRRISVIGSAHSVGGQPALWMPDGDGSVVIIVKDVREWSTEGKLSHRSLLSVSGDLSAESGNYYLSNTDYEWIDS